MFGRLIEALRPRHTFLIGNAFGFSSCYIAGAMQRGGGERVVTLDSQTEGDGQHCAAVARALADRMGLSILVNKKGLSPTDTASAIESDVHDLIFIDGAHKHPQVTRGFRCLWLPTSCEMVVGTRDAATFARLQATFPEGLDRFKHPSFLRSCGLIGRKLLRFHLGPRLGRKPIHPTSKTPEA